MNAFVTGGTGFIGSHLVDALIAHNSFDEIRCLVRNQEKWLEGSDYVKIKGDLHSINVIKEALDGVDIIFHLAGVVKAQTQQEYDYANVEATENIIRLAEKTGIKKIVILSSLAAAGPSDGHPKKESDSMKPISKYGESKKRMEKMIHRIAPIDMSITILRPPAVYGPREDQIFTLFKMMSKGFTPIVGNGFEPKLSIVYVQDVIQGIIKSSEQSKTGVHTYYISGDRITNWNEIKDISSTVLGKSSMSIKLKPEWVKKIAGVVETTASFFGTYPVINREKANEMVLEWTCSNEKAEKELNYIPDYSLEEGISRTLRWYKKHQWL
ncbi:MAG: NAD(P)-dependent oxidoreductase [Balneolaceae bacterium]